MWSLNNKTPFAAERAWVRDKNGAEVWVVALKGTFDFSATGQVTLSEQQLPVILAPEYADDNNTELLYDTDLPEYKLATDVILNGTAYAPGQQRQKQWMVNLSVGAINKTLLISGKRCWQQDFLNPVISEPELMRSLPLKYCYAFGGKTSPGTDEQSAFYSLNPVGLGYMSAKPVAIESPLPQIEYSSTPIKEWRDKPAPAGFSAIPSHWQARTCFAGTYDDAWENQRHPLLPEDFDPRFFQVAPVDQQAVGFLKGGERVTLTHLTPIDTLSFRLPKASFHLSTRFTNGYKKLHRAQLHTVIIEPDNHRIMMVWHSHLRCHHQVNQLESTSVQLKKRISHNMNNNNVWMA